METITSSKSKNRDYLSIFMFSLTASFYFYEYLLQVAPSVLTNHLMADFNISATTLGVILGSFFYSYTFMQIPVGLLYDYLGARKVLSIATFLCSLAALLFAQASSPHAIALARFTMGIGSSCAFVGILYISLRWFPYRYFALLSGIAQTLASLGAIAGQAPLATLNHQFSWRITIMILTIIGFLLFLLIMLFLRNQPRSKPLKKLPDTIHSTTKKSPSIIKMIRLVITNDQTWAIGIYSLCIYASMLLFASLWGIPFLMTRYGINQISASSACAMVWIGISAASPIIGWLSDYHQKRCIFLIISALIGLLSSLCIIYVAGDSLVILYLLLFILGIACGGQSLSFAVINDFQAKDVSSTAMGFNNMAVVSSGIIFQPLVGIILDHYWQGKVTNGIPVYPIHGYQMALLIMPICFTIAILVSKFWIKETHCQRHE